MPQVQAPTPFSQSLIWQLQQDYFANAGIEAWRSGQVPHYITSNPVVGQTYAELVLALLRDLALRGQQREKVYLLELGAGHGRLCYHFLKHFEKYYPSSAIPLPPFCYVLSDFTDANLAFWQDHPRLQPYLNQGWLDFARFDVTQSETIALQQAGITLQTQELRQPLIAIANYFFDTIPQELFWIHNQEITQVLLELTTPVAPVPSESAELLANLELHYSDQAVAAPIYAEEPLLNDLLEDYRHQLDRTHLLFPHMGIRCLERLRQLSQVGLMLLTADKGDHHLSQLGDRPPPQLVTHGSFSLSVNYHALQQYCHHQGGLAHFPRHQPTSLDLGCLLLLPEAATYRETSQAYERFVDDYGPDDYFSLKKLIEQHFETLTGRDILAIIRLSGYDTRIFTQMLPQLFELISTLSDPQRWTLFLAIPRLWDTHYPLGEAVDLAAALGDLLVALAFYREAIAYYEKSALIYGTEADARYKIAICHCLLGEFAMALAIVEAEPAHDPQNEALQQLLGQFKAELGTEQAKQQARAAVERAEAAEKALATERQAQQILRAKLQALGVDPDQLCESARGGEM